MFSGNIVHADIKLQNILIYADETYTEEFASQKRKLQEPNVSNIQIFKNEKNHLKKNNLRKAKKEVRTPKKLGRAGSGYLTQDKGEGVNSYLFLTCYT